MIPLLLIGGAVAAYFVLNKSAPPQPPPPQSTSTMQTWEVPGASGGITTQSYDPSTGYTATDYVSTSGSVGSRFDQAWRRRY
jgi:hypothetical protein